MDSRGDTALDDFEFWEKNLATTVLREFVVSFVMQNSFRWQ